MTQSHQPPGNPGSSGTPEDNQKSGDVQEPNNHLVNDAQGAPGQAGGTQAPHPDQLAQVEQLLVHFERLEQQLQQVRDGLTHSHRLATLGTIASIIAHEYNNILTPMISYGQLALARPDDAALMRKAVEKSLSGAERATKISSSLLGFAREADHEHAANLQQTIADAVSCLARDPEKDGVELKVDVPDLQLAITPLNLQQVLLNLILNAMQAMKPNGGGINLTGKCDGTIVHLWLADDGPGIPEQIKDRLFEPFATHRRDRNGKPSERRGTGLGLSICRDLIRNAGGTITVTSEAGEGTTFHITLPRADEIFETT